MPESPLLRQAMGEEAENVHVAARSPASASTGAPFTFGSVQGHVQGLRGGGRPLSPAVRGFFESRFNRSFGGVRVHSGTGAARVAASLNAKAFTVGRDVVFGAGQFAPETVVGKRLLAHELTHVVQQGEAPAWHRAQTPRWLTSSQGGHVQVAQGAPSGVLQKQVQPRSCATARKSLHLQVTTFGFAVIPNPFLRTPAGSNGRLVLQNHDDVAHNLHFRPAHQADRPSLDLGPLAEEEVKVIHHGGGMGQLVIEDKTVKATETITKCP